MQTAGDARYVVPFAVIPVELFDPVGGAAVALVPLDTTSGVEGIYGKGGAP